MAASLIRVWPVVCICLLMLVGCGRSTTADLVRARADALAARSEANAAKIELSKATTELNGLRKTAKRAETPFSGSTWKVNAHAVEGELVIDTVADGKIEGTMYGDKMRGTYDQTSGRMIFERFNAEGAAVQFYTGEAFDYMDENEVRQRIFGTFHGDGAIGGLRDIKMLWVADRRPSN